MNYGAIQIILNYISYLLTYLTELNSVVQYCHFMLVHFRCFVHFLTVGKGEGTSGEWGRAWGVAVYGEFAAEHTSKSIVNLTQL